MTPDPAIILPPPRANEGYRLEMWLGEQIWGHRLWDGTSPWLLFLEFLTVAEACHCEGLLLDTDRALQPLLYKPHRRMYLRNILFNNEAIARTAHENSNSVIAWDKWLNWMQEEAKLVPLPDFSYLKPRFHTFHDFARIVEMVRSSIIESDSNKRWTSRFVFPFGPAGLYEDSNESGEQDYSYFGRTGELLYLMLARCRYAAELKPHLEAYFTTPNKWNSVLSLLQPDMDDDRRTRGRSYLPYRQHPTFDRLGADWLHIFNLHLPGFDAFPHLVTLGALHMLLYQVVLATEWSNDPQSPTFVCEIMAPKKTLVRELSGESYQKNNNGPTRAVEARIKQVKGTPAWQEALAGSSASAVFETCVQIVQELFWWGNEYDGANNPDDLLAALRTEALKRHGQHSANIHRTYGGHIGLVSRRGTNRFRYAPTDSLLKTLVLANVTHRMELGEFLTRLYDHYGFVIGEHEAEKVLPKERSDKKAFQANANRLEQRLGSLGMLQRLSDGCAYVQNPYSRR